MPLFLWQFNAKRFETNRNTIHLILHLLASIRMVILKKCPSHPLASHIEWKTIFDYALHRNIVLVCFFFVWVCESLFVYFSSADTGCIEVHVKQNEREKHLNKSRTNNKYKRRIVAKWLKSSREEEAQSRIEISAIQIQCIAEKLNRMEMRVRCTLTGLFYWNVHERVFTTP